MRGGFFKKFATLAHGAAAGADLYSVGCPKVWFGYLVAGDLKNQHLLQRQPVAKNHIIDGPPCSNKNIYCGPSMMSGRREVLYSF
jgi:hypothetical protein